MKIKENQFVSLAYELSVDGKIVDSAKADKPLDFIFGMGMLLPAFEAQLDGKVVGDDFAFTLTAEEGYGAINEAAVVELPKDIFMVDGVVAEDLLTVGNTLPMGDNQGNRMMGVIKEVGPDVVTMDFNHPMAGKTLNFSGSVVAVRDSTEEDAAKFFAPSGEGCSCGSDCHCGDDCDCSTEGGEKCSSEGCNC
ncbi:MAG: peptidylprolyl isomerase [Mucinivorans sp.]